MDFSSGMGDEVGRKTILYIDNDYSVKFDLDYFRGSRGSCCGFCFLRRSLSRVIEDIFLVAKLGRSADALGRGPNPG